MTPDLNPEQAITVLNAVKYDSTEPMTSPYNKKIKAIRHKIHIAIGLAEADERSKS